MTASHSEFTDNSIETGSSGGTGGAVWVERDADITDSAFEGNAVTATSGSLDGGALTVQGALTLDSVLFLDNAADGGTRTRGGAVRAGGVDHGDRSVLRRELG